MTIDLRSDTATRPTALMLARMADAEIGSYVFGDDPESARLEREAAVLLGHEAAIFLPTATMANQVALAVHLRPGEEFIVASNSHVLVAEGGGPAAVAGAMPRAINCLDGVLQPQEIRACFAQTRRLPQLLWIENTHTRGGGTVTDVQHVEEYAVIVRLYGASLHVDGARLVNAAVHLDVPVAHLSSPADSVTLSLNKALGAPVGAILAGSSEFIEQAHNVRIRLGGFWRKPGHMAAAGRVALQTPRAVIRRDHAAAKRLAAALARIDGCTTAEPQTNIVLARFGSAQKAMRLRDSLAETGILVGMGDDLTLRLVTHYSADDQAINHVVSRLETWDARVA